MAGPVVSTEPLVSGTDAPGVRATHARVADQGLTTPRVVARRRGPALVLGVLGMATVSFNATRVAGWSVSDLLFLASGLAIGMMIFVGDKQLAPKSMRQGSHLVLAGAVIMLTGATISGLGAWNPLASIMVVVRLLWSTIVWFWILRSICRDRAALISLVNAFRFTVLVSAAIAVAGDYGLQIVSGDFGGRQAGLTFHPGELMNFLIVGLFLIVVPIFASSHELRRRFSTLGWLAGTLLVSLGIFATGSTSALIAIAVAAIVLVSVVVYAGPSRSARRHSPVFKLTLVGLLLAMMFALFTSDLPIVTRLSGLDDGSSGLDESLEARDRANQDIISSFDEYLLVGVGPYFAGSVAGSPATTEFVGEGEKHNHVHNMHLKMLYEAGLPALAGLWIIILAVGRQALRLVLATRGTALYPIALGLLGGFVAANTSSMFGPTAYARHFWLPFALVGCLWQVRRQELARAGGAATTVAESPHE